MCRKNFLESDLEINSWRPRLQNQDYGNYPLARFRQLYLYQNQLAFDEFYRFFVIEDLEPQPESDQDDSLLGQILFDGNKPEPIESSLYNRICCCWLFTLIIISISMVLKDLFSVIRWESK
ncbi:hypothetical protein SSS_09669 [Sarcoptes scabiei]|nr:hypothetical protein SSS_09669 [Sarcoptes scabiei]UXI23264.1 amyloid beta protein-binding member 1interacting protein [Sarcoptes scabiei]